MSFRFWSKSISLPVGGLYLHPGFVVLTCGEGDSAWVKEQAVAGYQQWPSAVASLLREAPEPSMNLNIVLASNFTQIIPIDKPAVADDELASAVPWAVKDLVADPLHELVMDYFHCASAPSAAERINVVCCRKQWIELIVEICTSCNVEIGLITTESVILANLIEKTAACQVLLWHVPGQEVELQIIRQGVLQFSRQLRGFSSLSQLDDVASNSLLLDDLSLELQRSMDYATGTLKLPDMSQLCLAVASPHVAVMAQLLGQNLTVPVVALPIFDAFAAENLRLAPALAALQEVVE
jgi:MSHA biogenesis protein MshI